jgi:hypothetical protein
MRRTCITHGEERNTYGVLMGAPEEREPLGRPRHRWKNGIKMNIRAIDWGNMDWIHLVQDRNQWRTLMNMVISFRVPQNVGKFLTG